MKLGSLILGFVVGVIVTYYASTRLQLSNAVELGFLNGKLEVMAQVCPALIEKSGVVRKKW